MKKIILFILPMLLVGASASAQNVVTGVVKDQIGLPVAGATVGIKGSTASAEVDSAGNFSIKAPDQLPFTLQVTFVGYTTYEVEVYELDGVPLNILLKEEGMVVATVTARRREEKVQDIPIPITVVGGKQIDDAGAFNVNRVKELVPSVQLYSSNPRNTGLNIRGLGSAFGLTNDGLDPGVGFYIDGVYYARPAAATLDFVDIERIEVLRGPQGTLFGKNTTAGAFNITTRKPSFKPGGTFEISAGNYRYIQAKASITGGIIKNRLAGRLSFSGTQRDGVIQNVSTGKWINDINNQGLRAQLLYTPSDKIDITVAGDFSQQRPDGYAQVVAGVVPTQRAAYRQFDAIIADLGYQLPSRNAFDRKIDHDTPWRSNNDLGGASLNADFKIGKGTLTSTSAWRYWNWDPSNDRDFTGLQVLAKSQNPAKHQNWSQEIRYAAKLSSKLSGVIGLFALGQQIKVSGTEESGDAQWRFSQNSTSANWSTPGLFEGYGIHTNSKLNSFTAAVFAQVDWNVFKGLHILPGIRFNYDEKQADYSRQTYGGLQTTNAALIALKNQVYSNQSFRKTAEEQNWSYNITTSYKFSDRFNAYATYAKSYKPVGVNLSGVPSSGGVPLTDLAVVKPEDVDHIEFGVKTAPTKRSTLNATFFNSDIKNYQTQVQAHDVSLNRGYLANAERVYVQGVEVDFNISVIKNLTFYGGVAYTEGKYKKFTNAPLPLEETGSSVAFKDISGGDLPGISKWAGSLGGEVSVDGKFFNNKGKFFIAVESFGRTKFSSSPSPSIYLNINEYALLNTRLGFRASEGLSFILWGRNILDKDYYEQLLPAGGNAGHYAAVLGDPRTYGGTIRYTF